MGLPQGTLPAAYATSPAQPPLPCAASCSSQRAARAGPGLSPGAAQPRKHTVSGHSVTFHLSAAGSLCSRHPLGVSCSGPPGCAQAAWSRWCVSAAGKGLLQPSWSPPSWQGTTGSPRPVHPQELAQQTCSWACFMPTFGVYSPLFWWTMSISDSRFCFSLTAPTAPRVAPARSVRHRSLGDLCGIDDLLRSHPDLSLTTVKGFSVHSGRPGVAAAP